MIYISNLIILYPSFLVELDQVERFIDWAEENINDLTDWDKTRLKFCYKAIDCVDLPPQKPPIKPISRG